MSQINKPTDYFNTKLYTGNGSTQSITGVGFQPDLVWGKNRSTTNWHDLEDSVRGATKRLSSNASDAEATETVNFTSFDSDGFSVGTGDNVNGNGNSIVVWNWLASNTTASNTDGSITSTVSANTTSGFSIVSYTGNGTSGATVGHGLGTAPKVVIVKGRTNVNSWRVQHASLGANYALDMDATSAANLQIGNWNNTAPTSSVFTLGNFGAVNENTINFIAYCFAEKQGFSKFGSYVGNGNADGTFIYTGFKPAFVMLKRTDSTGDWQIQDSKRPEYNPLPYYLEANNSNAEVDWTSSFPLDFVSNGMKIRNSGTQMNPSGGSFIYMAFAESPFTTSTGIPTTAR